MEFLQSVVDRTFITTDVLAMGMCSYILHKRDRYSEDKDIELLLHSMFKTWKHYSHNPMFPIPNPKSYAITKSGKRKAAEKAYYDAMSHFGLMYGNNAYADLRRDLAQHLINEIKQRGLME